jgi:hypothetical protein
MCLGRFVQTYQLIASRLNKLIQHNLVTRSCQASSVSRVIHLPSSNIGGGGRQDLVFARPPGVRDFYLSLDTVWYFRVLLLFSFETECPRQTLKSSVMNVPSCLFCGNTTKVKKKPFKTAKYI